MDNPTSVVKSNSQPTTSSSTPAALALAVLSSPLDDELSSLAETRAVAPEARRADGVSGGDEHWASFREAA